MSFSQKALSSQGFSLIELIIVVAIISILAAAAYPSYLQHIHKSNRATAAQSILECAAVLERRYTLNQNYTTDACDEITNEAYTISVTVDGLVRPNRSCTANSKNNCFLVTATSRDSKDDECDKMSLNELGVKTAYKTDGTTLNTVECWRTA